MAKKEKYRGNFAARQGLFLHTLRKQEKAFENYEKAYALKTNDANALAAYGLMLLRKEQDEKAIEVFKYATTLDLKPTQWLMLYQNLGIAYWVSGNLDRAVKLFERIYERSQSSNVRGTYGCLQIEKAAETGDYSEALAFCADCLDYDDEDSVILDNYAQVLYRMGKIEDAEKFFEKALAQKDDQFDTLYYLSKIRIDQGREDEAREMLEKALKKRKSRLNTVPRQKAVELAGSIGLVVEPQD